MHRLTLCYIVFQLSIADSFTRAQAVATIPVPDSIRLLSSQIQKSRPDSTRLDLLIKLNTLYLRGALKKPSDLHPVFELFKKIISLQKDLHVNVTSRLNRELEDAQEAAFMHTDPGNTKLADEYFKELLIIYKTAHYNRQHEIFDLMSDNEKRAGNLPQALYYNQEAIKSMLATGDTSQADRFYYGAGCTLAELQQFDQALPYLKKSFAILQRENYPEAYHFVLLTLSKCQRRVEGPARTLSDVRQAIAAHPAESLTDLKHDCQALGGCFMAMTRYKQAQKQFLEVIRLADLSKAGGKLSMSNYATDYQDIIGLYFRTKEFSKVDPYIKVLLAIPQTTLTPIEVSQIEKDAFRADSAAGRYHAALGHFERFKRLDDSLFNVTKSKQAAELQIKYETVQKNNDLLLQGKNIELLKKQSQLQATQVSQTRSNRNWILSGMVLLLAIGYYRYRLKQRTNQRLQNKQTEITAKNEELEALLHENEWLLREVHHRVKNNLQIVMSLLHSQCAYLKDEAALNAVLDSQHRVRAMSLIHQKLYKSNHSSEIYMPEYVSELVDYLKDSFTLQQSVYFELKIESIHLDISRAVPIGLILNEVITNALKYAFPYSSNDRLTIKLSRSSSENIYLEVKDNGRGFTNDVITADPQSFGLILMKGLTEDLDGSFEIKSDNGTVVSVEFKDIRIYRPQLA